MLILELNWVAIVCLKWISFSKMICTHYVHSTRIAKADIYIENEPENTFHNSIQNRMLFHNKNMFARKSDLF